VGEVMKKEWDVWAPRVREIAAEHADWSDVEVTWQLIEEMAARGAALLEPIWVREQGRKGRLSIQTNPTFHRSPERMLDQARHFATLAPNILVKFPATSAGIRAIEQATYEGISVNVTVCFTVPQALAAGEAVERGLRRRESDGLDVDHMGPVCTLMIGRLDDWMKALCERDDIIVDPAAPNWAGIAVIKRVGALFGERGYRARPLAAAYRNHLHWSELIGGDIALTLPFQWQKRFNASKVEVRARWDDPVPARYVDELLDRIPDFGRAYEPDGMTAAEFDDYGATVRTLRGFISSYWALVKTVDDLLLPDPDVKPKG
jgi:transaldolase